MGNVEDPKFLFRVGVVGSADKTKVRWLGPSEWMSDEEVSQLTFDVERGDTVVVDKKDKVTDESPSRLTWDTDEKWPAEAQGGSTTHVPYNF
jgi:hypothetical protein